jgi:hypothetical protein
VVVIVAPVLHELAGSLSEQDPSGWHRDPMRWAYAVREAVGMVRPSWVVSHYDLDFEARAIAAIAGEPDEVWDLSVTADGPFGPGIELVHTLAQIDPGWTVAASVTGPRHTASSLAERWAVGDAGRGELEEACGDVIAALVAAYAEAGASEMLVWEPEATVDAHAAHAAITRRAALSGVPLSLVASSPVEGYARRVGAGIVAVPSEAASDPAAWSAALSDAPADAVVVTDGPVPGNTSPEALVALTLGAV